MKRITFIAAAALAALAIAPGSALATGAHFLGMYKVEKHLDVEGEGGTYTISCKDSSDIAVDGMWRLDNVEQDDDYYYAPLHNTPFWYDVDLSLEPVQAYSSAKDTFTFAFLPQSGGDAQGKLFLTCLPGSVVVNNGHTHSWTVGSRVDDPSFSVPDSTSVLQPTTNAGATSCPTSTTDPEMAIAPGFKFNTDDYGKPYERWPDSVKQPLKWTWGFTSYEPGGATVTTSYRCLHLLSSAAGSPLHRHRIATSAKSQLQVGTASGLIDHNRVTEIQSICGEQYKGMLGAWDLGAANAATLWYFGMDPRPKARAYKILNSDPTVDYTPHSYSSNTPPRFALTCWKDRTS